ncbi:LysE family translocator [Desulfosporosinus hippei]|uniref:Threonine/homoserine/homoserine lactone efflux protein n=1 Tax=Desulfosporosinus hippei DSM 8344 TaxID=1121419 RepID=A0A1G8HRP3_9FIRM|nr:LysE family translocator [Desulfosporosinus hippei]SDI09161.1 Threonine/homoserine/homoserine lactone efflux protein [Desulfosporosinus hippei DSM 8344]
MEIDFLLKGFILGFSIAAPVGPIGILCIRRTLEYGRMSGFLSGLGAATADAAYGMIAGLGLTVVTSFLIGHQAWLRIVGGIFLCYLGIQTFIKRPTENPTLVNNYGLLGNYLSTFLLTLTNPMTIIAFVGVFAGLGLGTNKSSYLSSFSLVLGVFLGSGSWWMLLSFTINVFRKRFSASRLLWVNRVSGLIIIVFGLIALMTWE